MARNEGLAQNDLLKLDLRIRAFEWKTTDCKAVKDNTDAPDVSKRVVAAALRKLGSNVRGRANKRREFDTATTRKGLSKTEIDDFDVVVAVKKNVLEFQITVNNTTILVQVLQNTDKLAEDTAALALANAPFLLNKVQKATATRVLSDNDVVVFSVEMCVKICYKWMREVLKNVDLVCEM